MRIALCRTKPTDYGDMVLTALAKGFAQHGDHVVMVSSEADRGRLAECTLAVMVCSANRHQSMSSPPVRLRHAIEIGRAHV